MRPPMHCQSRYHFCCKKLSSSVSSCHPAVHAYGIYYASMDDFGPVQNKVSLQIKLMSAEIV